MPRATSNQSIFFFVDAAASCEEHVKPAEASAAIGVYVSTCVSMCVSMNPLAFYPSNDMLAIGGCDGQLMTHTHGAYKQP